MGKMLKRLDNHLLRCHQGVTRGINDRQPHFSSQSCRSRQTCMLPGCGKEVLHFSKHLKNIHAMSATDYLAKVEEKRESRGKRKSPSKYHTNIDKMNEPKRKKKDKSVNNKETNGMGFETVPKSDSSEAFTMQESPDVFRSEDEYPETTGMVFEAVPESNLSVDFTEQESPDVFRSEDKDAVYCKPSKLILEELSPGTYSKEKLRYLVHNTSPDGVRLLLVFVKRRGGLAEFHRSKFCTDIFGKMPFSTVKEIYLYRKYLTSFYRLARFYPYPDKEMINSCLACDATEKGQCSCPVLPKSFYIFCRQKCSSDFNCKKCIYFDHRPSHCFDFFHCKRCDEEYKASTKHQPYPQINNGAN